jgi:carbon monoxide dehydrogenase subunit G
MKLNDSFVVSVTRTEVYAFLTNPVHLIPVLSDIEDYEIHRLSYMWTNPGILLIPLSI